MQQGYDFYVASLGRGTVIDVLVYRNQGYNTGVAKYTLCEIVRCYAYQLTEVVQKHVSELQYNNNSYNSVYSLILDPSPFLNPTISYLQPSSVRGAESAPGSTIRNTIQPERSMGVAPQIIHDNPTTHLSDLRVPFPPNQTCQDKYSERHADDYQYDEDEEDEEDEDKEQQDAYGDYASEHRQIDYTKEGW